jgi:hypothetical protein
VELLGETQFRTKDLPRGANPIAATQLDKDKLQRRFVQEGFALFIANQLLLTRSLNLNAKYIGWADLVTKSRNTELRITRINGCSHYSIVK